MSCAHRSRSSESSWTALSGPQTVAELQAALRSASQENEHLARLTEDLLVLARARAGA